MTTRRTGLREQKKQATRQALCQAALRLALERGPNNVRVDDIAEAAGVSPRTYNNYFSNREQAIVAAITTERETRVAAAVAARPAVRLADAVIDAIVDQYTAQDESGRDALPLIASNFALRNAFVHTTTAMEDPLADAIAVRLGDTDTHIAHVLAASVTAAVRVTLERWLQPAHVNSGLVVPSGALPELLRAALAALAPALDAAENRQHRRHL